MCTLFTRYSDNKFTAPDSIIYYDSDELDEGCPGQLHNLATMGVSLTFTGYIHRAHDTLMRSDMIAFLKFVGVTVLEVANLANTALAVVESIFRIALAILALPFYFFSDEASFLYHYSQIAIEATLPCCIANIPGGIKQGWDMLTKDEPFEMGFLYAMCMA